MKRLDSRYHDVKRFAPDPLGRTAFKGLVPRLISKTPAVLEHIVVNGQRLDQLSQNFYNQDRRWWRIADANILFLNGGDLVAEERETQSQPATDNDPYDRVDMPGRVILIPKREND